MADNDAVDPADVAALRTGLDELRQAFEAQREAETAKEKAAAHEEVTEAKADLDALAGKLGVSRAALEGAMADAKKAERRAELEPLVDELIEAKLAALAEEEEGEGEGEGEGDDAAAKKAAKDKADADAKAAKAARNGEGDSGPITEHWSERHVKELLK